MLYDPVFIPPAVNDEIPTSPSWITVETPVNAQTVDALRKQLGKGESEAIALASEKACRIVLDDAKARSIAKRMNLKVIGTVGILVKPNTKESYSTSGRCWKDCEVTSFT